MARPSQKLATPKYELQRAAILDGAARVFNVKGVKGTTLADIAASVGLIKTSVTYYFKRKEDLAAACFARTIDTYNGLIDDAVAAASTPRQRIARFLANYFQLYRAIAAGERADLLLFGDLRAMTDPHVAPIFDAYTDMFRNVRRLLQAPEQTAADRQGLNARAHFLLSQVLWTTGWFLRYDLSDFDRVAKRMADIVADGVLVRGRRWSAPPPMLGLVRPSDAQEAFLQAATDLINEQGYHGASVEKISAKLNLTKGSFYHHYDAKDELVVACFERTFAVVHEAIEQTRHAPDNFERINRAGAQLIGFQLGERGPLLRTAALAALPEALREQMKTRFRFLADKVADLVSDGIAEGVFRPVDPFIASQVFTAMINSAQELRRWVPGSKEQAMLALYLAPFFDGIAGTAPRRP
jgi:AcrR family transcriptional regulator